MNRVCLKKLKIKIVLVKKSFHTFSAMFWFSAAVKIKCVHNRDYSDFKYKKAIEKK